VVTVQLDTIEGAGGDLRVENSSASAVEPLLLVFEVPPRDGNN
jgi:hypothetical protein